MTLQNAELQPKACYYDTVLNCKDIVAITIIAKDYDYNGKKCGNVHTKTHMYRTQKGRLAIYNLLKQAKDEG